MLFPSEAKAAVIKVKSSIFPIDYLNSVSTPYTYPTSMRKITDDSLKYGIPVVVPSFPDQYRKKRRHRASKLVKLPAWATPPAGIAGLFQSDAISYDVVYVEDSVVRLHVDKRDLNIVRMPFIMIVPK